MRLHVPSGSVSASPPLPVDDDLFCVVNGVRVKNVDISRLEPGRWLNDILVDAYASLFPFDSSSCFVHTCFFYARLLIDSLDRLARFYAVRGRLLS